MQDFIAKHSFEKFVVVGCALGLKVKSGSLAGLFIEKHWQVLSTLPGLSALLTCKCPHNHAHAKIEGSVTAESGHYPPEFASRFHRAYLAYVIDHRSTPRRPKQVRSTSTSSASALVAAILDFHDIQVPPAIGGPTTITPARAACIAACINRNCYDLKVLPETKTVKEDKVEDANALKSSVKTASDCKTKDFHSDVDLTDVQLRDSAYVHDSS